MSIIVTGTEGTCQWTLSNTGVLTIGEGVIRHTATDFGYWSWYPYEISSQVTRVVASANIRWASGANAFAMFSDFERLKFVDVSGFDTSNVTNMGYMFSGCHSITALDLSHFNTSNVTNMEFMFTLCHKASTIDVSGFDTSNVTNMESMFTDCRSITALDLSSFDTSNVTKMEEMFGDCVSLEALDLSGFNTGNVIDMSGMFDKCSSLTSLNLSGFDTSSVTDMRWMFYKCASLPYVELPVSNIISNEYVSDMLNGFSGELYIINATNSASVASRWRGIASYLGARAHYEADDNQKPDIIFSVGRVDSSGSETPTNEGRYAYLKAIVTLYENFLPRGWYNSLGTKTLTGAVSLSPWSDTNTGLVYTCKAWDYINSIAGHTYSLAIADSIKDANGNVKASHASNTITAILAKTATAISVYHDETTNTEGVAVGTFADKADLLEVAYDTQFNKDIYINLPNYQTPGDIDKIIYDALVKNGLSNCLKS